LTAIRAGDKITMCEALIETVRLVLRRFAMPDVDDLVVLHDDPEVKRFIPLPEPFDHERAIERIQTDQREWELGHRSLAIVERSTGGFLGRVTLHDWPDLGETEVGYVLRADARGNGYATEAARAFISWGFENLPLPYVTTMIAPDNAPSVRVAERLGMTTLRSEVLSDEALIVRSVSREEWERV
jgi:RimJ/RimL family protein N-acetyltransferase